MAHLLTLLFFTLFCAACASTPAPAPDALALKEAPEQAPAASKEPTDSLDDCDIERDEGVYTLSCPNYSIFTDLEASPTTLPASEREAQEAYTMQIIKSDPDTVVQGDPTTVFLDVKGGKSLFKRYVVVVEDEPYAYYVGWSTRQTARMHLCTIPEQTPAPVAQKLCARGVDHVADYAMLRRPTKFMIQGEARPTPRGCALGDHTITCKDPKESFASWHITQDKEAHDEDVSTYIKVLDDAYTSGFVRRTFPCYQGAVKLECTALIDLLRGESSYVISGEISPNLYSRTFCSGPRLSDGSVPRLCGHFLSTIPLPTAPKGCTLRAQPRLFEFTCGAYKASMVLNPFLKNIGAPLIATLHKSMAQHTLSSTESFTMSVGPTAFRRYLRPKDSPSLPEITYVGLPQGKHASWMQTCDVSKATSPQTDQARCTALLDQLLTHVSANMDYTFNAFGDQHSAPGCIVSDDRAICVDSSPYLIIWSQTTVKALFLSMKVRGVSVLDDLTNAPPAVTLRCTHHGDDVRCQYRRDPTTGKAVVHAEWKTKQGDMNTLICSGFHKSAKPKLPPLCDKILTLAP